MKPHSQKRQILVSLRSKKIRKIHTPAGSALRPGAMLGIASAQGSVLIPDNSPTTWIRHHLFLLGYEKVRLYAYQKLSPLTVQNGGGFIKTVVADLSSFVKTECARGGELFQRISNSFPIFEKTQIPDSKRFFMSLGIMMLRGNETDVRLLTDELLHSYMKNIKGTCSLQTSPIGHDERQVLKIASTYYRSCNINYRQLYDPKTGPRSIQIGDHSFSIDLPPLPQITSKQLLARALLHKELHPALTQPGHAVYEKLAQSKITCQSATTRVIRHDLSFLDGLGDLLIASESCSFLYRFRSSHPYSNDPSFGKKTFMLLRNILGTNTLLSRLATCYNLHLALDDPKVSSLLRKSYIPYTYCAIRGADRAQTAYEEEFLADYFEQYVGALFLHSPEVAKQWLAILFERILLSISDVYRISHKRRKVYQFDYRAWSVDVIGRCL
ncbi:hypothetical protein JCM33374_g6033 [Metschnikowia sp. JCM 33374]|nr:hypothetical protein JCM33374_g6033 [Metschnikowia sp. JCM 33374]